MNLEKINEYIYSYEYEVQITKGLPIPVRSSLVKLSSGELLWYSPGPLTPELKAEILSLGKLKYIIAPNLFHHVHLRAALKEFPDTECFIPKGLNEKKKTGYPSARVFSSFEELNLIEDFEGTVLIHHTYLRELVLLHKKSSCLLVTDFCFNFDGKFKNIWMKLVMTLFGAARGLHQSKLIKKTCKYPTEFLHDCHIVFKLAHKAESLLPAHGKYIEGTEFKESWEKLSKEIEKRYS
jgi:hypothetical protein